MRHRKDCLLNRHAGRITHSRTPTRYFDLNIEKVLEAWTISHALRELIANALDEQVLSGLAIAD